MESHIEVLQKAVKKFYLEERFFDVILSSNIDKKTVPAHSLILAAYSAYFCEKCMSSRPIVCPIVVHLDVKSDIIRNLVIYCYTGNADIEEHNMIELLSAALLLECDAMLKECKMFIGENLTPTNCLDVVDCAEQNKCKDLLEQAEVYLFDNFLLISETERFLQLSFVQLQSILDKNRKICSEEQLFNGVLKWVEHNQWAKEQYLPKLLPKIRIKSLETEFVLDNLDTIQLSAEAFKEAQELLIETYTLQEKNLRVSFDDAKKGSFAIDQECKEDMTICVIGCNPCPDSAITQLLFPSTSIRIYDNYSKSWMGLGLMAEAVYDAGALCVNDAILLVGGIFEGEATNCVAKVTFMPLSYQRLTFMKSKRVRPAVAAVNNYVYALGGADAFNVVMNTVERLDLSSGNWEYVANLNEARQGAGVAILDGVLYAVGGSYQGKPLRTVERYDVAANKWINCQPMTRERHHHGVATFKEYIYAAGGRDCNGDCLSSVERYDPLKDEWTKICDLQKARAGLSCISFENRLYAIGGRLEGTVETYDSDVDEWAMDSHLCDNYDSCIAMIKGKIEPIFSAFRFES